MKNRHKRPASRPRLSALASLLLTTALAAGCTAKSLIDVESSGLESPMAAGVTATMQGPGDAGTGGGAGSDSGAGGGGGSDAGASSGGGSHGASSGSGPGNGNGNAPNSGNGGGNLNGSGPGSGNGGANNGGGGRAH